jgi:predicted transposase YbfD/YdcC
MQCFLQSVSAWCHENGLVLAERQVDAGSHEIKAIPLLLEHLDIKGNTISIDAAGCQKSVTKIIAEKKGYYVLGLKRNHPRLYSAIETAMQANGMNSNNLLHDDFDEGHARLVRRRYFGYEVSTLPKLEGFVGAKSVVAVKTISSKDNDPTCKVSTRWRYYLSNHQSTNRQLANYVRNH